MTYETITLDQLTNRAANAYKSGDCGQPDTAQTFFSVQYFNESRKAWWNAFETVDQTEAEAEIALWKRQGGENDMRIVIVVKQPELVKEVEVIEAVAEVKATSEITEVIEIVAKQSVEVSTASTVSVETAKPVAKTYMEWNKVTHRYEAEIDGKLLCVEEETFADRLYAACKETTDDEYRIWGVLTWLSSWDFSGKQKGVCILEVAHV